MSPRKRLPLVLSLPQAPGRDAAWAFRSPSPFQLPKKNQFSGWLGAPTASGTMNVPYARPDHVKALLVQLGRESGRHDAADRSWTPGVALHAPRHLSLQGDWQDGGHTEDRLARIPCQRAPTAGSDWNGWAEGVGGRRRWTTAVTLSHRRQQVFERDRNGCSGSAGSSDHGDVQL